MSDQGGATITKDSQQRAQWVKRNLNRDVGKSGVTVGGNTPAREFTTLTRQSPYKDLPENVQTMLGTPMRNAIERGDQGGMETGLAQFKLNLQQMTARHAQWQLDAGRVLAIDQQVKHMERWGAGTAGALRGRVTAMQQQADQGNFLGAQSELTKLETDLPSELKRYYEAERAKLKTDEDKAKLIGDVPSYLTGVRTTYETSAKAVDDAVLVPDYVTAVDGLPQLTTDLQAALKMLKRSGVEKAAADNRTDIANTLKSPIKYKGTDMTVREAVGSKQWKKVVDKIVSTKLDDEFMDRYNKACDEVIDEFSKNDIIKDAAKNWKTWTKDFDTNKDKIQAAMQEMLRIQSSKLGWPTPTASPYDDDDGDLGSYDGSQNYPPGKLNVNFHYKGAKDFRELMDTVTHENTHAYQEKLIKDFRAGTLKPGDENYAAALTLEMNDTNVNGSRGYISGEKSASYKLLQPDYAYEKQPCEAHAWAAGRKIGRGAWKNLKKNK